MKQISGRVREGGTRVISLLLMQIIIRVQSLPAFKKYSKSGLNSCSGCCCLALLWNCFYRFWLTSCHQVRMLNCESINHSAIATHVLKAINRQTRCWSRTSIGNGVMLRDIAHAKSQRQHNQLLVLCYVWDLDLMRCKPHPIWDTVRG